MQIENLYQELMSKMDSLKTELNTYERQKEVISIIMNLKSIRDLRQGYNGVSGMKISPEAVVDFISLLSPNEYLKGYSSGGRDIFGSHPTEYKYDNYYLTLGTGIVLNLSLCKTEIKGYREPIKESDLTLQVYVDSQDLHIKVDTDEYGRAEIEILKQDGTNIFNSQTTSEYLRYNNQNLNEALLPISAEDLTNRFFDRLQNQNKRMV